MRAFGRVLLDGRDAPRDLEGGARWVERAVERGSSSAKLLYAELLATGRGVPAEPERARRLWFEAAEHIRDAAPREPAFMVLLARVFLASRWTVPDPAASREWLERAAARGSRDARRILARGWDEWDE
jgi:TPR repeat protein